MPVKHQERPRKSLNDLKGKGFVGWYWIIKLADECMNTGRKSLRNRAIVSALETTGGRVQEVLMLHRDNFIIEDDFLIVCNISY